MWPVLFVTHFRTELLSLNMNGRTFADVYRFSDPTCIPALEKQPPQRLVPTYRRHAYFSRLLRFWCGKNTTGLFKDWVLEAALLGTSRASAKWHQRSTNANVVFQTTSPPHSAVQWRQQRFAPSMLWWADNHKHGALKDAVGKCKPWYQLLT